MTFTRFVGIGLAAGGAAIMLGLAACASPPAVSAAGTQAQATLPVATPPAAPPPSSAPAAPTPRPTAFSPLDIQAALGKVDSELALDGNVIGHDDILKSIPRSTQALQQLKIQPAECAAFTQVDLSKATANAALGSIAAHLGEPSKSVSVSVISYVSADLAQPESIAQDRADLARCPVYSMQVNGMSLKGTMKAVDVSIPGADAIGTVTQVEAANLVQRAVMVRVVRGPLRIAVTVGAAGASEATAVGRARDIAAATMAALDRGPSASLGVATGVGA